MNFLKKAFDFPILQRLYLRQRYINALLFLPTSLKYDGNELVLKENLLTIAKQYKKGKILEQIKNPLYISAERSILLWIKGNFFSIIIYDQEDPIKRALALPYSLSRIKNSFNEIEVETISFCNRKCSYCPNVSLDDLIPWFCFNG